MIDIVAELHKRIVNKRIVDVKNAKFEFLYIK